jgi:FKBP-type peptidyl-prolyl cis-trans isomerase FklB
LTNSFNFQENIMSEIDFSSTETKASYGIGLQMGQQLAGVFEGVSLQAAISGITTAFNQEAPTLNSEEVNAAFSEMQERLQTEDAANASQFSAEGEAFLVENAKREGVIVTESGLQYEIITEGTGEIPTAGSTVRTHYAGTLIDGTEFDSSYKRGEPAEFPVSGVIGGWTEALQLMPIGSKWKLCIPHELAYGAQGAGGAIGPYQALTFDIELIDIV